ncbi:u3 small nucleolar RNA-associated protein 15-like protein [Chrysochromulina tobinii]|uniref:U3 small nucleolar RNA-associated protein 15-like protein n=1 Tax=Chrysochromulina tobinii TaxID=1460289 RepID=A0A0M0K0L9_9EUKA|nr:u3 small nucleolar RNA-associated protein 15-like protein [Chrysochromulina tobinii]|eukprot:KOO32355.1 u3 small nucleolar RNA-associated protein 15-like protein [Chrysochromulina sp. CCMP291]
MWRMSKYSRLLYFDPDVFWTGDAWRYFERYGHTAHLAAAQYTDDLVPAFWRTTGMPYINSGILLLRPSEREYASLVRRWHLGNFTAMQDTLQDPKAKRPVGGLAGRSKASEQDLIVAHFQERLTPMDMCENFRGYVKGSTAGQARCRPSSIIAWHGPLVFRQKAPPSSISFSPVAPFDFAFTSSLQVDVFSTQTNAVYRTLTRFKDVVRCASYRHDGKLLAAGDEGGCTQLFDLGSRTVMRTFTGHSRAVHVAKFMGDGGRLLTASDDGRAICWDVASEAQVCALEGHTDHIRSGALDPASPHVFATGSYDHTVKLWDVNAPRCVMTLRHVAPVEDVFILPGGGMVATASGNTLTVWDLLSGGRVLYAVSAHSKTITSLCADASAAHLLTASLDRSVKVYEMRTCKLVDGRGAAAIGPRHGTYRYFLRGRRHAAQPGDFVISSSLPAKLAGWDAALRRFRYHEAFDAALADGSPEVVVSVVEELVQRHGLRIALQGRDQQTLQPVVAFLARQICHPPFAPTLIGVANLLLDMYAPVLGQSAAIDELFVKLRNTLEAEMKLQAELAQLLGSMDVLLAGSVHASSSLPPPRKVPRLAIAATSSTDSGAKAGPVY